VKPNSTPSSKVDVRKTGSKKSRNIVSALGMFSRYIQGVQRLNLFDANHATMVI